MNTKFLQSGDTQTTAVNARLAPFQLPHLPYASPVQAKVMNTKFVQSGDTQITPVNARLAPFQLPHLPYTSPIQT